MFDIYQKPQFFEANLLRFCVDLSYNVCKFVIQKTYILERTCKQKWTVLFNLFYIKMYEIFG